MTKIALLPIRPRFAEAILRGEKKVEFRRKTFGDKVKYVVIYVSSPVQKVVGFFEVDKIFRTSPSEAWELFQDVGSINEDEFAEYYRGTDQAASITIKNVKQFRSPIEVSQINNSFLPPQSYRYVSTAEFEKLKLID